jgi:UDPglucose 6-dehydrogenase
VYAEPLGAGVARLAMDLETAELVKVAANASLATKISFINAIADVCAATGTDVAQLAAALGHDERIGRRFLSPCLGFGGGRLPKDIRAFRATALDLGVSSVAGLLAEVDAINENRRAVVTVHDPAALANAARAGQPRRLGSASSSSPRRQASSARPRMAMVRMPENTRAVLR